MEVLRIGVLMNSSCRFNWNTYLIIPFASSWGEADGNMLFLATIRQCSEIVSYLIPLNLLSRGLVSDSNFRQVHWVTN
jgi:hypothetical protein